MINAVFILINKKPKNLLLGIFLVILAFGANAQFQLDGLDFTIVNPPISGGSANTCPTGWTQRTASTMPNNIAGGNFCLISGDYTGALKSNGGQVWVLESADFRPSGYQDIKNTKFYNYGDRFVLRGTSPGGKIDLYNFGKVSENGISNINQPFVIYNNVNDTVTFNNMTQVSNIQFNNNGYLIFNKAPLMNSSAEINNNGYIEFEKGTNDLNAVFRNAGRISVGSGTFKLQNPSIFENGCGILIKGNLNTQSSVINDGVFLYTGNWNAQGNIIYNTENGRVSGGSLSGSTGTLTGFGEFYFTGAFEAGLKLGNNNNITIGGQNFTANDYNFTINDKGGKNKTGTGTITEDTDMTPATVDDFPVGCSPIVVVDNQAPTTSSITINVCEDASITNLDTLTYISSDPDGDALTYTITTDPTNGTASLNNTTEGKLSYTPTANFFGQDNIIVMVSDGTADVTSTITINVLPKNDQLTAVNDNETMQEDGGAEDFDVVANDTDPTDGLTITTLNNISNLSIVNGPSTGTASVRNSNKIRYTPPANFSGVVTITYKVCDSTLNKDLCSDTVTCSQANLVITVENTNDAPLPEDDAITVVEDSEDNAFNLSATDIDGDDLTFTVKTEPTKGTVNINTDGSYTYTPTGNYYGADAFTFDVCDADICETGTISITVTALNDAPEITDDLYTLNEGTSVIANVTLNDDDEIDTQHGSGGINDTTVTIVSGKDVTNGTTTISADGKITYTPNENFFGRDSLEYNVCDLGFEEPINTTKCGTAWAVFIVVNVNDDPIAIDSAIGIIEDSENNVFNLQGTDLDGDQLYFKLSSAPIHGTVTIEDDGEYSYTPNEDYYGQDVFTFDVCDDAAKTNCTEGEIEISVTALNDAPVTEKDFITVDEDSEDNIAEVLSNDNDNIDKQYGEGGLNLSSVSIVTVPNHGTASENTDGEILYTPSNNFFGIDSLEYNVCDIGYEEPTNTIECSSNWLIITVENVNDLPVANEDVASVCEDGVVLIDVLDNDNDNLDNITDISGYTLEIITPDPNFGSATVTSGQIEYIPAEDRNGVDTVFYKVTDLGTPSRSAESFAVITVKAINDAPVANKVVVTAPEIVMTVIDVKQASTANDNKDYTISDPVNQIDYNNISIIEGLDVTEGTLINNNDGTFNFTPATGINNATFNVVYEICDLGLGDNDCAGTPYSPLCDRDTIEIQISARAPRLVDDVKEGLDGDTLWEDESIVIDVLANDTDPNDDIDPTSVTVIGIDGNGTNGINVGDATVDVNPLTGALTITPDPNYYTGTENSISFTYRVQDAEGFSGQANVTVRVFAKNDPPQANQDIANTNEDEFIIIPVLTNDRDTADKFTPTGAIDPSSLTLNVSAYLTTVGPYNGTVEIVNDSIKYTPAENFFGVDSFYYAVSDLAYGEGSFASSFEDTALVIVNVAPVNDPPVITSTNTLIVTFEETRSDEFDLTTIISDTIDDTEATIDVSLITITDPIHGDISLNNGVITYLPFRDYYSPIANVATDSATFTVEGVNGKIYFNVLPINDTLFLNYESEDEKIIDRVTVREDETSPIDWTIEVNDNRDTQYGLGGIDTLSIEAVTIVDGKGISPNGSFTWIKDSIYYTPNENYSGSDTITFNICDLKNAGPNEIGSLDSTVCLTASIIVNVTNDNDTPEIENPNLVIESIWEDDSSLVYNIFDNVTDADNNLDTASFSIVSIKGINANLNNNDFAQVNIDGGTYSIVPSNNYYTRDTLILDTIRYTISDKLGETVEGNILYVVKAINDTMVFDNIQESTIEDQAVTFNWVNHFSDSLDTKYGLGGIDVNGLTPDSINVSNEGVSTLLGTFTQTGDSISYLPFPDVNGIDTLKFTVCDLKTAGPNTKTSIDSSICIDAFVIINITGDNDPPVTQQDSGSAFTILEDQVGQFNLLLNDFDTEGTQISLLDSVITDPSNGIWSINSDSVLTYTPNRNYFGLDSIEYIITDEVNNTSGWLYISILPVNDAPIAINDTVRISERIGFIINAPYLENDNDITDSVLTDHIFYDEAVKFVNIEASTFEITSEVRFKDGSIPNFENDDLEIDTANGTFTYINEPFNNKELYFEYKICDSLGLCDTARVTLIIDPFDDLPNIPDTSSISCTKLDSELLSFDEDGEYNNIDLSSYVWDDGKDEDNRPTTLLFDKVLPISNIREYDISSSGIMTLYPNENYNGRVEFFFTVRDVGNSDNTSDTKSLKGCVFITPVNDAPFAINDTLEVQEDSLLTFNLLANDFDIDTTSYQYDTIKANPIQLIGEGTYGTFDLDIVTGIVTYVPDADISNVTDSIQYVIFDTLHVKNSPQWNNTWSYQILSDTAWIKITVSDRNDPPTIVPNPNPTPNPPVIEGPKFISSKDTATYPGVEVGDSVMFVYLTTEQLTPVSFNVFIRDKDRDIPELTLISAPKNGELSEFITPEEIEDFTFNFELEYIPGLDEDDRYPFVGTEYITIKVDDRNGGIIKVIVAIEVTPSTIIIYDGFSPNGDGFNDEWIIEHIEEYPENSVQIFNRWGNLVWDASGYNNSDKLFNGYNNSNNELTTGTYYYVIEVSELGKSFSGYVIINR